MGERVLLVGSAGGEVSLCTTVELLALRAELHTSIAYPTFILTSHEIRGARGDGWDDPTG